MVMLAPCDHTSMVMLCVVRLVDCVQFLCLMLELDYRFT